jgi:hypothetical protein
VSGGLGETEPGRTWRPRAYGPELAIQGD